MKFMVVDEANEMEQIKELEIGQGDVLVAKFPLNTHIALRQHVIELLTKVVTNPQENPVIDMPDNIQLIVLKVGKEEDND